MIHKFATMKRYLFLLLFKMIFLLTLLAQNGSVFSNGNWYKITTNQEGVYKLKYSDFIALGISVIDIQTNAIKLYGNGGGMLPRLNSDFRHSDLTENAIKVQDYNNNGLFENGDYILFYGMSANVWNFNENTNLFEFETHLFSDEVNYFLTIDNQSVGKRVDEKIFLQNPSQTITSFSAYAVHEEELENLISSGSKWFGE